MDDVVAALRRSREVTHNIREGGVARRLPSRAAIAKIVDDLSAVLFPTHYGQPELGPESVDGFVRDTLARTLDGLAEQIHRAHPVTSNDGESAGRVARDIVTAFAERLPVLRALLVSDLRAAYEGDPAATTLLEVLLSYPGMIAVISYRIARALHLLGAPLIARG